jgi:hypothetical protein
MYCKKEMIGIICRNYLDSAPEKIEEWKKKKQHPADRDGRRPRDSTFQGVVSVKKI